MTLEEAMNNIDAVCAAFQGNRQQHVALQESLRVIREAIAKPEQEVPDATVPV